MVVDEAWVELKTEDGRTYFWNRRANSRAWALPEGISIKWVGQKSPDGRTYYWSRENKETVWVLPPLIGVSGDATNQAAVVGQGGEGNAGTTPGGTGLPSPAPASFPTAGPAATVVAGSTRPAHDDGAGERAGAGEDGVFAMEQPEKPIPCVFPEIEPPGPRGDSASAVAARHMIVASGCDSWFHQLPSGEWEEVLRFWPPAADLMLAVQPKIRNARPDPYGLRELVMRCQKHEELVRALLVAQYGTADGFSAAKFPCPQEWDWCFWKQDGTQLVINADKPHPTVDDAACVEPAVPLIKRCPPEGGRWRLLKTGLRSNFCMVFRGKQLRKLERAIRQEEKSTVQSILSLLSSDVPEKLARAAQKLLVPLASKPLPPETPHEPDQSGPRTGGRIPGFAPAMVPYHQSGVSKAAAGAAAATFAQPGTMPPLLTPLRAPSLGTPCGTLPAHPASVVMGQADSQLPLRPQGVSPSPFAKRAVFKAMSMPVAGAAAPDASGEAVRVGQEGIAELGTKAPSLSGAFELPGKAGSLPSPTETFAKMQPPEFLSKSAGMQGALAPDHFAKSMPSGARFAGKAQAEPPGFVAGRAPSVESGWNGNQGSAATAVGNFGKSYALLPTTKGDLLGMAAALAAKVEAFGQGTTPIAGAAGTMPGQTPLTLFAPPPTKAPPSLGVPQWKAPPATEPADAQSTTGFAVPSLPVAPFVPVLPPPKAAPTAPASPDVGTEHAVAAHVAASPALPQLLVPAAPPAPPAPDPEAAAKVAAAAFAAAAAGDRSSEAAGEKKRTVPTSGADGGPATEAPWKKRRRNTRSSEAPVEQAAKEQAAVESAAAPPKSAKVGRPEVRKVVVGNLPTEMKADELADFFTGAIFSATGHTLAAQWQSGEASKVILGVDLTPNGALAEVTFGTALGATVAVALNGIQFQGKTLDIKRPKNFGGPPLQRSKLQNLSLKDLIASDGTDKEASTKSKGEALGAAVVAAGGDDGSGATVRLSGVPSSMSSKSVFDLLQQFGGPLRSLDLSADKASGEHQGHGVAEYEDRSHALEAVRFSPLLGFIEIKMIASASTNAGTAQAAVSPPSAKRERRTRFDPTEAGEDLGPFEAALQQREQVKAMEDEPLDLGPFEAVLPPKRGAGTTSVLLQDGNR